MQYVFTLVYLNEGSVAALPLSTPSGLQGGSWSPAPMRSHRPAVFHMDGIMSSKYYFRTERMAVATAVPFSQFRSLLRDTEREI